MPTDLLIQRVTHAMEEAQCLGREGPYGLYVYAGSDRPHRVRDFRTLGDPNFGRTVFSSSDPEAAKAMYEQLTKEHVAGAVLNVIGLHLVAEALRTMLEETE